MSEGLSSPSKKLSKFVYTTSKTSSPKTSSTKRKGLLGRKKSALGGLASIATQPDITKNIIKNQRDFQAHEISEMRCFEGELLKIVKKIMQRSSKAITFFNTKYYKGM